jgi:hypothetical protein
MSDVSVYPDSNKIGVFAGSATLSKDFASKAYLVGFYKNEPVDYFVGETEDPNIKW